MYAGFVLTSDHHCLFFSLSIDLFAVFKLLFIGWRLLARDDWDVLVFLLPLYHIHSTKAKIGGIQRMNDAYKRTTLSFGNIYS